MHPAQPTTADELAELAEVSSKVLSNVGRVVVGSAEVARLALVVLLAEGHLLLEDVPGVGKTTLAKALARSVACSVGRVQFTPDLLPSDLSGVSIWNPQTRLFEFHPGAIFANLVLGDEINRASPRTQSALLEAMAEQQVTVDGATHPLPAPFMVVATQNPVEMAGTHPLPEAQLDRFTARTSLGYPDPEAETGTLVAQSRADPLEQLEPVVDVPTLLRMTEATRHVHVSPVLGRYVVDLLGATRRSPLLRLGASPRAGLHLLRTSQALAALEGRDHVLPDDVQALTGVVLTHRLVLTPEASAQGRTASGVLAELLEETPVRV